MSATAEPPDGTAWGTIHILRAGPTERAFKWTGVAWNKMDSRWGLKPDAMYERGWRYVSPAIFIDPRCVPNVSAQP